jgi:hypothetical protein
MFRESQNASVWRPANLQVTLYDEELLILHAFPVHIVYVWIETTSHVSALWGPLDKASPYN